MSLGHIDTGNIRPTMRVGHNLTLYIQLVPTDPIEFEELEKIRGWMRLLFHR